MRIGFDARMITHPGIGRYIKNILSGMLGQQGPENFCLFGNQDRLSVFSSCTEIVPYDAKIYGINEVLYQGFNNKELNVLHVPHYNVPWRKGNYKLIVTIHDLIHLKVKGVANYCKQKVFLTMLSKVVNYADKIVAVSESTKDDIISFFPKAESKINVIYEAADDEFKMIDKNNSALGMLKEKYCLPEKIILFVGTVKPHKNIAGLIDAYLKLKAKGVQHTLVIVGRYNEKENRLLSKIHSSDALFLGEVPSEHLPALYNLAQLLVMPSFCEGFGFPVLEAMACGTPVVTSKVSSLPEVVGEAGIYFNPNNSDNIAEAISKVLSDEQLRQDLIVKGFERVKNFSWQKAAEETLSIYERVLSSKL
ncbi:MAG: glycosyltransferase family 1 protein [Candidatus Omnitrophota bacterium]